MAVLDSPFLHVVLQLLMDLLGFLNHSSATYLGEKSFVQQNILIHVLRGECAAAAGGSHIGMQSMHVHISEGKRGKEGKKKLQRHYSNQHSSQHFKEPAVKLNYACGRVA